ncbi:Uncharacterised protein [Mycobacteroides abscessus subsp. abscessus]|uniref:hypothetical protein n=1 Tax=Mycobacteroides abscessus TaxID=36809 RepID=UPI000926EAA2|nr:hypothetical protein [Mycobacteroides abscessus]QSM03798.1 hypothetical protein PROPHIGD05-3_17 [Mycobacterium phage prophiGD05-3]MDM2350544.1 hypothetical protein [Mycobacteroides abscessus]MDM2357803.1 hypothetical protein [Mycobacteroides abscessus]QSN50909.1 hypothetical protein I3U39_19190 [Mycobacteroides abscessus subsp. abscessus]SHU92471.1 Uncharacterised protein [Mycobacteroides abscessus subsp. abscessus]
MNSIYEPYVGSAEDREAMDYGKHSSGCVVSWRGLSRWKPSYVGRHRAESTGAGA